MLFTQSDNVTNAVKEKLRDCIREVDWPSAWKQTVCARKIESQYGLSANIPLIFFLCRWINEWWTDWWIAVRRCAGRYAASGQFYAVLECVRKTSSRWINCAAAFSVWVFARNNPNHVIKTTGMLPYLFRRRLVSASGGWCYPCMLLSHAYPRLHSQVFCDA